MKLAMTLLLLVFGVLGFSANLLFRGILIYEDWEQDIPINWWWQTFLIFGIPVACLLAFVEVLAILGFFSHQSAVFDFSITP